RNVVVGFGQTVVPVVITKRFDVSATQVQSDPAALDCGIICSATFSAGNHVTFTPSNAVFQDHGVECVTVPFSGTLVSGLHLELVGFGVPSGFVPGRPGFQEVPATMAIAPHILEIKRAGTGSGIVTSDPAGVYCQESSCSAQFNDGNLFTLNATPSPGSSF